MSNHVLDVLICTVSFIHYSMLVSPVGIEPGFPAHQPKVLTIRPGGPHQGTRATSLREPDSLDREVVIKVRGLPLYKSLIH
jgi:hypothetical protein